MERAPLGEVTVQLLRWRAGEEAALTALTPLVYDQLRILAGRFVQRNAGPNALQATELVGELFVSLLSARKVEINDRAHFFALCARVMRQILIHQAREGSAAKRGNGQRLLPLDAELAWTGAGEEPSRLDLDGALNELEQLDEPSARAVELRYLFGFTAEEAAEVLGVSKATVDRQVRFALAWLHGRLHR